MDIWLLYVINQFTLGEEVFLQREQNNARFIYLKTSKFITTVLSELDVFIDKAFFLFARLESAPGIWGKRSGYFMTNSEVIL